MSVKRFTYIYIAGPESHGDSVVNIRNALAVADELINHGFVPFVPHLQHTWHLATPKPREFWVNYDLAWLRRCQAVLRMMGPSIGADETIQYCRRHGVPFFYTLTELLEACATSAEEPFINEFERRSSRDRSPTLPPLPPLPDEGTSIGKKPNGGPPPKD